MAVKALYDYDFPSADGAGIVGVEGDDGHGVSPSRAELRPRAHGGAFAALRWVARVQPGFHPGYAAWPVQRSQLALSGEVLNSPPSAPMSKW